MEGVFFRKKEKEKEKQNRCSIYLQWNYLYYHVFPLPFFIHNATKLIDEDK